MRKQLGRYIVVDSGICHGQATFHVGESLEALGYLVQGIGHSTPRSR